MPHDLILVKDPDDWETKTSWGNTVYVQSKFSNGLTVLLLCL